MEKITILMIIVISSASIADAKEPSRKFYLTQAEFNGSQALTACADGYHMASLWEIYDPSNLRYNPTLGQTTGDSGFGPPSVFSGWIRTGSDSIGTFQAGLGNCHSWTSNDPIEDGSVVRLSDDWDSGAELV